MKTFSEWLAEMHGPGVTKTWTPKIVAQRSGPMRPTMAGTGDGTYAGQEIVEQLLQMVAQHFNLDPQKVRKGSGVASPRHDPEAVTLYARAHAIWLALVQNVGRVGMNAFGFAIQKPLKDRRYQSKMAAATEDPEYHHLAAAFQQQSSTG